MGGIQEEREKHAENWPAVKGTKEGKARPSGTLDKRKNHRQRRHGNLWLRERSRGGGFEKGNLNWINTNSPPIGV